MSLVFFGMDGPFSTVLLQALVAGSERPSLVVVAVPPAATSRAPVVQAMPVTRSGWSAVFGGAEPPVSKSSEPLLDRAHQLGIDVLCTSDPDALRARAAIHQREPELFVVAGFPRLLGRELLSLPRRGGLNVHPGNLPAERGPSPVFWALREGRTELGFAIHILEEGEDRGDLVASGRYQIEPGTEIQEVYRRCAQAAAPQLLRAVRGCRAGELVRTPQPKEGAGRCPRPTFRDGRIEPGRPAEQVFGFVAGCAKDFSLFVEIAGDRFFVKRARSFDPRRTLPSEYVLDGETLFLACDPGVVVLELKPGGALFSAEYDEER